MRLLLLFAVLFATGCRERAAQTRQTGRIVAITDAVVARGGKDTVRFGRMHEGEIAVVQLRFENRTARPTTIEGYRRSCGCTTLTYENQPLNPGESQRAELSFDSRGLRGWQLKTLDVRFAGGQGELRLYVEAEVE